MHLNVKVVKLNLKKCRNQCWFLLYCCALSFVIVSCYSAQTHVMCLIFSDFLCDLRCLLVSVANAECGTNEEFKERGPACQTSCAGLGQPCCHTFNVAPSACYCKEGFSRSSEGKCIPTDSTDCQNENIPTFVADCKLNKAATEYQNH